MKKTGKKYLVILISLFCLAAVFLLSLCVGAEKINIFKVLSGGNASPGAAGAWSGAAGALSSAASSGNGTASVSGGAAIDISRVILLKLRLPRSILVLVTGILLGGAGAVFQLFFRNPLAEPGIMGISSGATLGAVIAQVCGLGASVAGGAGAAGAAAHAVSAAGTAGGTLGFAMFISPVNLFAFIGALASGIIVVLLALGKSREGSSIMLLLCGTALGTLYSAISSIVLLMSKNEMRSIYAWTMGSFNGHGWKELYFIAVPAVISLVMMFLISGPLDLLSGGEKSAQSLGVDVNRLRILVLVCGALAVSCAVCAGGTIGFVGLIAPHIVRKLYSPKGKQLIPGSMIFGAIILLLADTLARVVMQPGELPAGIITSVLGVPFFLSLILSERKHD